MRRSHLFGERTTLKFRQRLLWAEVAEDCGFPLKSSEYQSDGFYERRMWDRPRRHIERGWKHQTKKKKQYLK